VIGGQVYIVNTASNGDKVLRFDPVSGAWSTLAPTFDPVPGAWSTLALSMGVFGRTLVLSSCLRMLPEV
jgi:hypothetical protein